MGDSTDELHELLHGWPHRGLVRAGNADPFSGFLLVGARIDALASLIYDVVPGDRKQRSRYARFVTDFFPSRYRDLGLGPVMWSDLRSAPIHFLSSSGRLALADSQPPCQSAPHQARAELRHPALARVSPRLRVGAGQTLGSDSARF